MKKSLTIEELRSKIGKPVFVIAATEEFKNKTAWYVLSKINEYEYKADNKNHGYIEFTDCNCINFGNAQFFRFFDTEVTEKELKEILDAEEKEKKKTGYEIVDESKSYFYINEELEISEEYTYINGNCIDSKRSKNGNHFNDETLTINLARAERLRYQLRRFAALNGGISSAAEWFSYSSLEGGINWKYYIEYDYENQKMQINCTLTNKSFGQIYFKSEEACEKAIETFKDELLWYFTEFKEQLY